MTLEEYAAKDVEVTAAVERILNIGGRKLASIRRVSAIEPIPGADRIVLAQIDGWKVVTQKGNFEVGDLCVYFEIDSFLPVEERFEFLRKACFRSTANLGDGFKIKTVKLRGQISQGLVLPLSEFHEFDQIGDMQVAGEIDVIGHDVTELLGVKKWELPGSVVMRGDALAPFPINIPKTDQERAQNLIAEISARKDEFFEVSMKLDGSSMTVYRDADGSVGVCSRNVNLKENDDNVFWKTAKARGLIDFMRDRAGVAIALQGELMGPGIQGNRETLSDHQFFVFDIYNITQGTYYKPQTRAQAFEYLASEGISVEHVPIIHHKITLRELLTTGDVVADLMRVAEGASLQNDTREGVVFKSHSSGFTFKIISNQFLMDEAA